MSSITTTLPDNDIEVVVEYEVRGRREPFIVYSAAYIDNRELPATKLSYIDKLGNKVKLADYFNFILQEEANILLRECA